MTLFIIATVVFLLLRLMPEEGYFNAEEYDKLDAIQREAILTQMGLRDPIHVQLTNFYRNLLRGDLGKSVVFRPGVPVIRVLKPKAPFSIYFGLSSVALSLLIGIPMGVFMARFKGKFFDNFGSSYVVLINAIPAAVYYLFFGDAGPADALQHTSAEKLDSADHQHVSERHRLLRHVDATLYGGRTEPGLCKAGAR